MMTRKKRTQTWNRTLANLSDVKPEKTQKGGLKVGRVNCVSWKVSQKLLLVGKVDVSKSGKTVNCLNGFFCFYAKWVSVNVTQGTLNRERNPLPLFKYCRDQNHFWTELSWEEKKKMVKLKSIKVHYLPSKMDRPALWQRPFLLFHVICRHFSAHWLTLRVNVSPTLQVRRAFESRASSFARGCCGWALPRA